jgi:hypothetical protein
MLKQKIKCFLGKHCSPLIDMEVTGKKAFMCGEDEPLRVILRIHPCCARMKPVVISGKIW